MFKWIKMWLGIDEPKKPEPKQELPADFAAVAPFVDVMAPGLVKKKEVKENKVDAPLTPTDILNVATGKKKTTAKKPAKKVTRMPNKLDKGK